jgi:hypothetical protein
VVGIVGERRVAAAALFLIELTGRLVNKVIFGFRKIKVEKFIIRGDFLEKNIGEVVKRLCKKNNIFPSESKFEIIET